MRVTTKQTKKLSKRTAEVKNGLLHIGCKTVMQIDSSISVVSKGYAFFGKSVVPKESYSSLMARLAAIKGWCSKGKVKTKKKRVFVQTGEFLKSYEWRKLRLKALKLNDGRCECCGRSKQDGIVLHVDHIKPRKKYPELALALSNLQVLCHECNHGKGNWDETDWREPSLKVLMGEGV